MSKYSRRLLILALLSAFAVGSTASAVAGEKERDKDKQRASEREQVRGHEQSGEGGHDNDRHEKGRGEHDNEASISMKTSVVTVTNRGASPLTITAAPAISRLSGNGNFAIVPPGTGTPCAPSLVVAARGGECTIGVKYIPSDGGKSSARLILTDSGAATPTQETIIRSDD